MVIVLRRSETQRDEQTRLQQQVQRTEQTSRTDRTLKPVELSKTNKVYKASETFKAESLKTKHKIWLELTHDQYILKAIEGYHLEFEEFPYELMGNDVVEQRFSENERSLLANELVKLESLGVIQQVTGFINEHDQVLSPIFLTEKKDGSKRMILNLKQLNQYMRYEHFKMENIEKAKEILRQDCYMASVDLEKAYYSVSIHVDHRKFLRFKFEGKTYEYTCLPNGLSTAPRLFTKIMRVLFSCLRKEGVISTTYIDDSLIMAPSKETCTAAVCKAVQLFQRAGFFINWEKSVLDPTQKIEYLGFLVDSHHMLLSLPERKLNKMKDKIQQLFCNLDNLVIQDVASVVGTIISVLPAFKHGKLFYREIEHCKNSCLKGSYGDFNGKCRLTENAVQQLQYWHDNCQDMVGNPVKPRPIDIEIHTDASQKSWGAITECYQIGGEWSVKEIFEAETNINVLELLAVKKSLQGLLPCLVKKSILVRCDNSTAVHYINQMGGHNSKKCDQMSCDIWSYCIQHGIWLQAVHIAGKDNQKADFMSRLTDTKNTEWSLSDSTFQKIVSKYGKPVIDLFASKTNKKCDSYVSWKADPDAIAVDAFSISWNFDTLVYMFPPFSLIGKVLQKVETDCSRNIIIVYPEWTAQTWYPQLQQRIKEVMRLPAQPFTKEHPLGHSLKLRSGLL